MFVIGVIFGHLAYNSLHIKGECIFIALLGVIAFITNQKTEGIVGILGTGFLRLFCTLVLCMVLSWLEDKDFFQPFFNVIKLILKWFGRYTLELYVLHIFLWKFLSHFWANILVASVASVLFSICLAAPLHKTIDRLMRKMNKIGRAHV